MKHYIDITLLPSDDIGIHFLWSKVMMQVHLALVEIQGKDKKVAIAASFPQYRRKLASNNAFIGNKLRLFAQDETEFSRLNINKWLNRLEDYVHIKAIAPVPDNVTTYENFSLPRKLGSPNSLITRRMKRHNETKEQAKAHFEGFKMDPAIKALPFIKLKSLNGGDEFNMAIKQRNAEKNNEALRFNTYGFNSKVGLPKF